ncbi:MAG TPA: peptidoglycan editing factor PgeF [Hyphomicrobiales bacterium]|nr:peptidoglycan editing factor PgeF [Hyphomicrobiales bacterium]
MIQSALLTAIPNVRHGFFTRQGGHSAGIYASLNCGFGSGDDETAVRKNREAVAARLGVDADHLMTVWQSHSPDVVMVEAAWDVREPPDADAMVTRRPGMALGVLTADCTPILFADRRGRAVGVAHAGWKGALGGILEAAVAAFDSQGVRVTDLTAVIGPTIGQANYEVGPEFYDRFAVEDPENRRFFAASSRNGHHLFDLPGYVRTKLEALGLAEIDDLGLCTYADEERFFSYRRATHRGEPDYGRLISAIVLET